MMTTTKTLAALSIAFAALSGCALDGEEILETEPLTYDQFVERYIDVAVDVDTGEEYLSYDDDMPLASWDDVKPLYAAYQEVAVNGEAASEAIVGQVYGTDLKWPANQKRNLTYCISNKFFYAKQLMINAMAQATADWERHANVDFKYLKQHDANCTKSNNAVLFNVELVNIPNGFFAQAFFPVVHNRANRQLFVNWAQVKVKGSGSNVSLWSGPNAEVPIAGVLRHELGHTLGLRHETGRIELVSKYGNNCFESNFSYRALTGADESSSMMTPRCVPWSILRTKNKSLVISAGDKAGIRKLYP